jgi:catechol 2,3-dioxygenase-like lactoylglutathione lyase family enzyme
MINAFNRIIIAVPDLAAAVAQYETLLGGSAFSCTVRGAPAAWLGLSNTVLELVQDAVETSVIRGLVLSSVSAQEDDQPLVNPLQLDIHVCDGQKTDNFRRRQPGAQSDGLLVDHLVLRTTDAQACIELFARQLGIRLALDKSAPAWGGRMLFFRTGKLTLEVIASDSDQVTDNSFWGIAYQCPDLELACSHLGARGVEVSEIREGRKPGTRVATVKSHCLGIPTLLVEPAT